MWSPRRSVDFCGAVGRAYSATCSAVQPCHGRRLGPELAGERGRRPRRPHCAGARIRRRHQGGPPAVRSAALGGPVRSGRLVAEHGFPVGRGRERQFELREDVLSRTPEGREIFFGGQGRLRRWCEVFSHPAFARTLRHVAADGPEWMYKGPWPASSSTWWAAKAARPPAWAEPVTADFHGHRVHALGGPGRGGAALALYPEPGRPGRPGRSGRGSGVAVLDDPDRAAGPSRRPSVSAGAGGEQCLGR